MPDVDITLKRCTGCHRWKSYDEFSKMARSKDGRQPQCKECAAAYYTANRTSLIPGIRARKKRAVLEARLFVWDYLRSHPCIDCGEADPMVLDFDHVTGQKYANRETGNLARPSTWSLRVQVPHGARKALSANG